MESALYFEHKKVLAHKTRGHTILKCIRGMDLYSLNLIWGNLWGIAIE